MTLLHEAVDAKILDTRMVERNVARGAVKAESVTAAEKALPDDSANAEYTNVDTLAEDPDARSSR